MPLTKEEADAQLHQAIVLHAEACGYLQDGELLGDYAVVAQWRKMSDEAAGIDHYTTHYHRYDVSQHVAIGLHRIGLLLALSEDED